MTRRATAYAHSRRRGRDVLSSASSAPATPPLDAFANAPLAAWSDWRRLLTSYTGPLNRIRKTTGGDVVTQQDVPYAAGTNLLDDAARAAFVGAQSWAVVTSYDQAAGARNVTQATAGFQPRGGTGGVASKIGTHDASDYDGAGTNLARADALGLVGAQSITVYLEAHCDAVPSARYFQFLGQSVAGQAFLVLANTATSIQVSIAGSNRIFTCPDLTSTPINKILVAYGSGNGIGTVRCWHNGVELSELSSLNPANVMNIANNFCVHGASSVGGSVLDGQLPERVTWNADFGAGGNAADLARALAL